MHSTFTCPDRTAQTDHQSREDPGAGRRDHDKQQRLPWSGPQGQRPVGKGFGHTEHGILGEGAPSPEFVGVAFPDGSVFGDENNVKLRFDTTYMKMASDGML